MQNDCVETSSHKIKGFCELDRFWWLGDHFLVDVPWSIEEKPQTRTFDPDYARKMAVNIVLSHGGYLAVLLVDLQPDGCCEVFEIVVSSIDQDDKAFAEALAKSFPDVPVVRVDMKQDPYVLGTDTSMDTYNGNSARIREMLSSVLNKVLDRPQNVRMKLGHPLALGWDSISWHWGMDGCVYFVLHGKMGSTPGMQKYRLEQQLSRGSLQQQQTAMEQLEQILSFLY